MIWIKQATSTGVIPMVDGGVADLSFPTSKTRRGRVQEKGEVSPTIMCGETGICRIMKLGNKEYRIRKLTPKECFRLQDLSGENDEEFKRAEAVCSDTLLYSQAGNSITVNCLVGIFGQMFEGHENDYKNIGKPYHD